MPKLWKCTACGQVSFWDAATFNCYSSHMVDEDAPQWRIVTCAAACLSKARDNLAAGKWIAATVKPRGYACKITIGKGYLPQPSQQKLLTEYNEQHATFKQPRP